MSFFNIFNVAGSGMAAQSVRLGTTASNLANANSTSSSRAGVYRAREPVFATIQRGMQADDGNAGVRVAGIVQSAKPVEKRYAPNNPVANAKGYVFSPNVNPVAEMVNMLSASRSYKDNVEVMNTARELMLRTLRLGQ
jgi:flagellar basal-body rod protein FlgC